jgi:alanine racemase
VTAGPTIATIDRAALRANFAEAQRRAAGREVIAVVKADAYGHGAVSVGRALEESGCRTLAVVSVAEAAELREAGLRSKILVLAGIHDATEARDASALGLTPVVHHPGQLALVAAAAREADRPSSVHVEVDTGMRRMGVPVEEAPALLESVSREPALVLEGVFTHLARADEPDPAPSLDQLAVFRSVLEKALARGISPGQVHTLNSAGLLLGEPLVDVAPATSAVRPGLMLYGASPADHLEVALSPVMTLRTRVVHVRSVESGEGVGYTALYRPALRTRIATLALGYADGIPIATSNRGQVILAGDRHPIVGRVSMDYVTVDVGDAEVAVGDEAIVFGEGQGARLPVEEAAEAAGTLSYELLVRVGSRVKRVLTDSNDE